MEKLLFFLSVTRLKDREAVNANVPVLSGRPRFPTRCNKAACRGRGVTESVSKVLAKSCLTSRTGKGANYSLKATCLLVSLQTPYRFCPYLVIYFLLLINTLHPSAAAAPAPLTKCNTHCEPSSDKVCPLLLWEEEDRKKKKEKNFTARWSSVHPRRLTSFSSRVQICCQQTGWSTDDVIKSRRGLRFIYSLSAAFVLLQKFRKSQLVRLSCSTFRPLSPRRG